MQTILYGLALIGVYAIIAATVREWRSLGVTMRVVDGDTTEIARQIAGLIAKARPEEHGRLFSLVGSRLIELGLLHTAGTCYRIALEIFPETDDDVE